jgi:hypothetical protein
MLWATAQKATLRRVCAVVRRVCAATSSRHADCTVFRDWTELLTVRVGALVSFRVNQQGGRKSRMKMKMRMRLRIKIRIKIRTKPRDTSA